jgi:hypothetical protein
MKIKEGQIVGIKSAPEGLTVIPARVVGLPSVPGSGYTVQFGAGNISSFGATRIVPAEDWMIDEYLGYVKRSQAAKPKKHYHYHVSYRQGRNRVLDPVPFTSKPAAQYQAATVFNAEDKPRVKRVDATETCGGCGF